MRLLVFGGRTFASLFPSRAEGSWLPPEVLEIRRKQRALMFAILDGVLAKHRIDLLIHGGAPGADSTAGEWAISRGIPVTVFHALWAVYGHRKAGPIRNTQMLHEGKPDRAIGFPGNNGTVDMLKKCKGSPLVDTWTVDAEGSWSHHL